MREGHATGAHFASGVDGARSLRRLVQRQLLGREILAGEILDLSGVVVDFAGGELSFRIKPPAGAAYSLLPLFRGRNFDGARHRCLELALIEPQGLPEKEIEVFLRRQPSRVRAALERARHDRSNRPIKGESGIEQRDCPG